MKYQPGQSGNPNGRPKGILDKRTALSVLLKPHAEALIDKAIEMALAGDMTALKLCLERLIPKARDEAVKFDIHANLTKTDALLHVGEQILRTVAEGNLTPEQGRSLASLLDMQRKTIETTELAARLQAIEASLKQRSNTL
jgi:hypothetical protein